MSSPANTIRFDLILGATHVDDVGPDLICRDEACQELALHTIHSGYCRRRPRERSLNTRSRVFAGTPWRAYCYEALHDSVYSAVSLCEPRNFSTVFHHVENDYGSCCKRSVHRHLNDLCTEGSIVRMDFSGSIRAYLRAGSRMLSDPDLVFEQIMNLRAGEAA